MFERKNKNKKKIKIMVFGTFDGVHKGHLNFFKQAKNVVKSKLKNAEPFLIVSIARDKNVFKIKNRIPTFSEKERVKLVKKYKNNSENKDKSLVDKVVLGGTKNYIPHVIKERPDIIALGYDQKAYVKNLKKDLKNKGLLVKVVRLKSHKPYIYKNVLLKKKR
ncbi:MAG: adenylyltransferase/cytidyltransferase family protein [Patescibacteria group bacterium]